MDTEFVYGIVRKGSLIKLTGKGGFGIVLSCEVGSGTEMTGNNPFIYRVLLAGEMIKLIRESFKLIQRL